MASAGETVTECESCSAFKRTTSPARTASSTHPDEAWPRALASATIRYMKPISVHLPERPYQELKSVAARKGKPVAELLRVAMIEYLERERRSSHSVLDLPPHPSGRLKRKWSRTELLDEMRER